MTLLDLFKILQAVGIPVSHYEGELDEYPYIVYQEFSTAYDTASGKAYKERTRSEVVHYTKMEFDPTFELLKNVLLKNDLNFIVATTFDRESKVIINRLEVTTMQLIVTENSTMEVGA